MAKSEARRKKARRRLIVVTLAALVLLAGDCWMYPIYGRPGDRSLDQSKNGIWMRYTWYFGEKGQAEIQAAAKRLAEHRIRDAYFHVRYIKPDGTLKFRFPEEARRLNRVIGQEAPGVRSFAWIYGGHGKLGDVDLSKAEVRQKMADEAAWLVAECGFDGIQWDYEICPDGDAKFLDLLDRTRRALPIGTPVSVAAPMWFPIKGVGWSPGYFAEVARRCDQIAVMCYDSGFYFPRAYTWLVERQAHKIPGWVKRANGSCEVILGLPAYEEGPPSHNSHAENLRHALWGVRKAANREVDGIAIFADYTMEDQEWETLRDLWTTSG
jgi:hypothetical protein